MGLLQGRQKWWEGGCDHDVTFWEPLLLWAHDLGGVCQMPLNLQTFDGTETLSTPLGDDVQ